MPKNTISYNASSALSLNPTTQRRLTISAHVWLAIACLCYSALAFLISPQIYRHMAGIYGLLVMLAAPGLAICGLLAAALVMNPRRPLTTIAVLLRDRGAGAVAVFGFFVLTFTAYTTLKLNIPNVVPFYADPMLADLGEFLHGQAPWIILHAALPGWFADLLKHAYGSIWLLQMLCLATLAAFCSRSPFHLRYLWALTLTTIIVGTVLAATLSSVGPIFYTDFYGEARFEELVNLLRSNPANDQILRLSSYLLKNYHSGSPELGSGISAMPSMHVAIATINALYLTGINRWAGIAGWMFCILILVGSIYSGWHYSIDGYASIAVVLVVWRATRFIAEPRDAGQTSTNVNQPSIAVPQT